MTVNDPRTPLAAMLLERLAPAAETRTGPQRRGRRPGGALQNMTIPQGRMTKHDTS